MDWKNRRIDALLEQALIEDKAASDLTTQLTIDPNLRATATILARQELIVAGLGCIPVIFDIFARLDARADAKNGTKQASTRYEVISHPEIFDGVRAHDGQTLAVIRHNARALLSCERVILNLMQHMSGIATLTRQFADQIAGANAHVQTRVLDTRKTVPGLRALDKYAVLCGGGTNHRLDLSDGILIKNNHIALGGGVKQVLNRALAGRKPGQRVQIEVRTTKELEDALQNGAEALLLDNMTPEQVAAAVVRVKQYEAIREEANPSDTGEKKPWIPTEASGGIVLENIRAYAMAGVDFISVGALTHSAKAADISMRIKAETR
jgi:nicotinate-nucleotide pyrophosphorylase (carboxylating)